MILPRTALFQTPSASANSQTKSQPQTPPPSPSSESWSFTTSLPVSYRVAIFLDASILLFTLAILIAAILYIRNRRPAPRSFSRNANHIIRSILKVRSSEVGLGFRTGPEGEGLLYSDQNSPRDMGESPTRTENAGAVGIARSSGTGVGEKKKKGHVRWTPSVQGGEAFGIPEKGSMKEKGRERRANGNGDGSVCSCRGRRHPGCWRYEFKFQEGTKAAKERQEELRGN